MYSRILTFVFFFSCLCSAAQAGVIRNSDWDSELTVSEGVAPDNGPVRLERGEETQSVGVPSTSSLPFGGVMFFTSETLELVPNLVGYIVQADHISPPSPILDGLIKPA